MGQQRVIVVTGATGGVGRAVARRFGARGDAVALLARGPDGLGRGGQGFHESVRTELLHDGSNVHVTMVQLPAVNTPQFDWVLSRLRRKAQPVPPIYQPEVAASGIVYAADHPRRREYWVGGSTAATLLANAVAPGLLDRYLARTGFRGQQTDQPRDPDQPANLWQPADGPREPDYGAPGRFAR